MLCTDDCLSISSIQTHGPRVIISLVRYYPVCLSKRTPPNTRRTCHHKARLSTRTYDVAYGEEIAYVYLMYSFCARCRVQHARYYIVITETIQPEIPRVQRIGETNDSRRLRFSRRSLTPKLKRVYTCITCNRGNENTFSRREYNIYNTTKTSRFEQFSGGGGGQ